MASNAKIPRPVQKQRNDWILLMPIIIEWPWFRSPFFSFGSSIMNSQYVKFGTFFPSLPEAKSSVLDSERPLLTNHKRLLVMKLLFPVQHHHIFRRQSFSSLKKSLMNPLMNSFLQNHVTLWNTLSSIFRCTFCTFRNPEKHKGYLLSQHTVQRQWIFRTFRFWFRFSNSGFRIPELFTI